MTTGNPAKAGKRPTRQGRVTGQSTGNESGNLLVNPEIIKRFDKADPSINRLFPVFRVQADHEFPLLVLPGVAQCPALAGDIGREGGISAEADAGSPAPA